MREARMKQECVRLAEVVEHTVHKAHEHAGIEAHGARDVEQDHQPQWFVLAPAPHEIDRHTTAADIATDGAAYVEASTLALCALAPGEPGAHLSGEPRRERVGFGDGLRVGDSAEVCLSQVLGARGALHSAARAVRCVQRVGIAAGYQLAEPRGAAWAFGPCERKGFGGRDGACVWAHLYNAPHAATQPMRIEQVVKFVPVRTTGAQEGFQGRPQRDDAPTCVARQHAGSIFALLQAKREGVLPQRAREPSKLAQSEFAGVRRIDELVLLAPHQATFPKSRALTSRVKRARSSWVLSRQRRVSWAVSRSSCRSFTPSPTRAAAQSSVSATPGTLRNSSLRRPSSMRAICQAGLLEIPGTRAKMMRVSRSAPG